MGRFTLQLGLLLFFGLASAASAYIPPVRGLVESVFDRRKPQPGIEVSFQHRVQLPGGKTVQVGERILRNGNRVQFLWTVSGYPKVIGGYRKGGRYVMNAETTFPSRTVVFLQYFLYDNPSTLLNSLVKEQFVSRNQLADFEPAYQPKGDPHLWKTKELYKRHPNIFLTRTPSGISIAVVGTNESSLKKAVYFQRQGNGIERLEWVEGNNKAAWDFGNFSKKLDAPGWYPKRMTFEYEGADRVFSTVSAVNRINNKEVASFEAAFRNSQRAGTLPAEVQEALSLLLSYR